jgi:uncharacterized protein YkwD
MTFLRSAPTIATLALTAFSMTAAVIVPVMFSTNPAIAQTAPTTVQIERDAFNRINTYRRGKGLPALVWNEAIATEARKHSQNMANGTVPFSHQGFADRLVAIKIVYASAAENVAANSGYANPAERAATGWFNSPGHETNIRGNFGLSAVGVAKNAAGQIYFTQLFIKVR